MQTSVACIQFCPQLGKAQPNLDRIELLLREASSNQASLVILPEMCINGYLHPSQSAVKPFVEESQGKTARFLGDLCQELGLYLVYGFAEILDGQYYNSQNLLSPRGEVIGTYQKQHLFTADLPWATPGPGPYLSISTELGKIGLGICMDLNFVDLPYFHQCQGTDILALSMHWLEEGLDVKSYWIQRLLGFSGMSVIANSYGKSGGIEFCGRSSMITEGQILCSAAARGEQIIYQSLG